MAAIVELIEPPECLEQRILHQIDGVHDMTGPPWQPPPGPTAERAGFPPEERAQRARVAGTGLAQQLFRRTERLAVGRRPEVCHGTGPVRLAGCSLSHGSVRSRLHHCPSSSPTAQYCSTSLAAFVDHPLFDRAGFGLELERCEGARDDTDLPRGVEHIPAFIRPYAWVLEAFFKRISVHRYLINVRLSASIGNEEPACTSFTTRLERPVD